MDRTKGAERNILCIYKGLLRMIHYSSMVKCMISFMTEDGITDRRTPPKQYPLSFWDGDIQQELAKPKSSF